MDVWLYPGAAMSVTALTKVTLTPAAIGEVPPVGATVIPPQVPLSANLINQAVAANLAVAQQGQAAAEKVTAQSIQDANKLLEQSLAATNRQAGVAPPWEVTFTEKRT